MGIVQFFSSPLRRTITILFAGSPRGKLDAVVLGCVPYFDRAGANIAFKFSEGWRKFGQCGSRSGGMPAVAGANGNRTTWRTFKALEPLKMKWARRKREAP